ncbi:sigma-70 family RNA polymerase sigma factor [Kitasatospora cineracea]|uniref:RNA polymerase sigma-70 factor (ECF subfamily) n=1 Tax=Kitasatospora cineracea TaxID=88074 RepID=A0A3N4RUV0_9ACTN|nr:sigma-70 family RNA polymerase sigma factor [Kitasatospora cineracea]ROR46948.1 RNA polymerase sigma-70 factor (ECF subfamily) [Kitasatospora cineracea]RPE37112.1 RNA polymerase sigma-70 factor (ECF subfamily) [Kitasatospora cineracea]
MRSAPLLADAQPLPGDVRSPRAERLRGLLDRTARGDRAAYTGLYEELAPTVYGIALRVLRDPAQAEETAQEALLEMWRSAPTYRPERGSVAAWACTIAHRRAVDRVRSVRASCEREQRVVREDPTRPEQVAEEVERTMEAARVRRALSGLTAGQREALVLAYYGGYSQSQIAAALGLPLGTVKSRTRDGLLRLRSALHDG